MSCRVFLGAILRLRSSTGICLCTWHECHYSSCSSHIDYHVTVSPRTHEQPRDKRDFVLCFHPMVHGVAHGWRHILHFRNVCTECIPAVSSHSRIFCTAGVNRQGRLQPRCDPPTTPPHFATNTGHITASPAWWTPTPRLTTQPRRRSPTHRIYFESLQYEAPQEV